MGFIDYDDFSKLQALAKKPLDLTTEGVISNERIAKYALKAGAYKLLYSLERIDDQVMEALFGVAAESKALTKMTSQQAGEEVNLFEERAALHTATRDFFAEPNQSGKAKEATKLAAAEIEKLKAFLKETEGQFDDLIHIGIGGSFLGPEAVWEALKLYSNQKIKKPWFIANVDPDEAYSVLKEVDLKRTLVVVVSKSGSTLETSVNEQIIRTALEKKGLKPEEHMVSVTTPKSLMDDTKHYRKVFYFGDYIGGRFSVTSMVGAVSLSFVLGLDLFLEFLKGASLMDKVALQEPKKNLPLLLALLGIWKRNFLNLPTLAVIPYSSALKKFCLYLQQLDMESNGKSVDLKKVRVTFATAPFVFGDSGSNAQHSFFQMLHQGTDISAQEFIGFKKSQLEEDLKVQGTTTQEKLCANLFGSALALALGKKNKDLNQNFAGNRPTSILMAEKLTPLSLGQLIALYEHKIAFQGYIWGIDSFDQEGVQLGKKTSNQFLKAMQGEEHPLASAFLKLL